MRDVMGLHTTRHELSHLRLQTHRGRAEAPGPEKKPGGWMGGFQPLPPACSLSPARRGPAENRGQVPSASYREPRRGSRSSV